MKLISRRITLVLSTKLFERAMALYNRNTEEFTSPDALVRRALHEFCEREERKRLPIRQRLNLLLQR